MTQMRHVLDETQSNEVHNNNSADDDGDHSNRSTHDHAHSSPRLPVKTPHPGLLSTILEASSLLSTVGGDGDLQEVVLLGERNA